MAPAVGWGWLRSYWRRGRRADRAAGAWGFRAFGRFGGRCAVRRARVGSFGFGVDFWWETGNFGVADRGGPCYVDGRKLLGFAGSHRPLGKKNMMPSPFESDLVKWKLRKHSFFLSH